MSYAEERAAIETEFVANWPHTPVDFENVEPVDRLKTARDAGNPWVRLTINNGEADVAALGGSTLLYRHTGVITVQIFTEIGIGTEKARDLADKAAAIFRGKRITHNGTTVKCYAATARPAGSTGGWYQINVTIPFIRDEEL